MVSRRNVRVGAARSVRRRVGESAGDGCLEGKYARRTSMGWKIVKTYSDRRDGRIHVIADRGEEGLEPYCIGIGYNPESGSWGQGRYDYPTIEDAENWLKAHYDVVPCVKKTDSVKEGLEDELEDYVKWCSGKGLLPQDFDNFRKYFDEVDEGRGKRESAARCRRHALREFDSRKYNAEHEVHLISNRIEDMLEYKPEDTDWEDVALRLAKGAIDNADDYTLEVLHQYFGETNERTLAKRLADAALDEVIW